MPHIAVNRPPHSLLPTDGIDFMQVTWERDFGAGYPLKAMDLLCCRMYKHHVTLKACKALTLSPLVTDVFIVHVINPFGTFGPPCLAKAVAAARAVLPSLTSACWVRLQQPPRAALPSLTRACWVFSCFRNPPNSDMDYRILNVRTESFLCVRIHTGVGHTDESAQHF